MNQDKLKLSPAEAHLLRKNIREMKLKTPKWFELLTNAELASACNTAKTHHVSKEVNKALGKLCGFAEEAILIHRVEYRYLKRFHPLDYYSQRNFHAANRRLCENAKSLAKTRSLWGSLRRYWRLLLCYHARHVADEWGYDEWIA
jgi:ATP phosphoribosyltransferase regulatory subunit HisZ